MQSHAPIWGDKDLRMHYEEAIKEVVAAEMDNKGDFELLEAATEGDEDRIRRLLSQRSSKLDATSKFQSRTALHLAAQAGHGTLARILLENGADMQQRSSSGDTAFFIAIKTGHAALVKLFLENGASVHEKSNRLSGISPLYMAIRYGHPDVVKELIKAGADLEARGRDSSTALTFSLWQSHNKINYEVIRVLVEAGARISPESWREFPPELREQYADRCPIRSVDVATDPFEEMLNIDDELNHNKNVEEEEPLDTNNMQPFIIAVAYRLEYIRR